MDGLPYGAALKLLHAELRPANYLEIGTQTGATLAIAQCASIAVDVDFQLSENFMGNKPWCGLYQMPSDLFFATQDPTALFGGPVEMAFLDGMHHFEFLLRDFINTEKHCRPDSVIVLHDCLPRDGHAARREENDFSRAATSAHPEHWAGDAWKTLAILRAWRPDLSIRVLDCPPTGLALITALDPHSAILAERYADIVRDARRFRWK